MKLLSELDAIKSAKLSPHGQFFATTTISCLEYLKQLSFALQKTIESITTEEIVHSIKKDLELFE